VKLQEIMKLSASLLALSNTSNRELVCTTIASTAVNTIPKYSRKDLFIIDSGVAISVYNNINWFNDFTKKYEAIRVGSQVDNCLGIGTITIRPNIGGRDLNGVSLTVRNVRYIPSFHTNIVSSAQMHDIGLKPLLGKQIVIYKGEF
jgi:hypothetical protein